MTANLDLYLCKDFTSHYVYIPSVRLLASLKDPRPRELLADLWCSLFSPVDRCPSGIFLPSFLYCFFFCSSSKHRLTSPLRRAAPFVGDKCFDFPLLPLGEATFKDERPDISEWISVAAQGLAAAAAPHRHRHSYVLFCTMSYLLIYSTPPPSPTAPACRSLLIFPIKINFRLKIPTLAHQRGRNRGGGGLARSAALSLTSVFLKKVSRFNFPAGKN